MVVAGAKLIEVADLASRLAALEATVAARRADPGLDAFPDVD